jgi:hypothetical protein
MNAIPVCYNMFAFDCEFFIKKSNYITLINYIILICALYLFICNSSVAAEMIVTECITCTFLNFETVNMQRMMQNF